MKVYSIGRENGCDIVINDSTDVISRRHAVLNVSPSGKMTIVDQSHNGTYVNGIRISPNVPVPVTRKDNISFAHVARLDWNMVPKSSSASMRYVVIGLVALVFAGGIFYGTRNMGSNESQPDGVAAVDTLHKKDSTDNAKKDSLEKDKKDSVDKAKKETTKKATPADKKKTASKKSAENNRAKTKQASSNETNPKKQGESKRFR